jgi:hypothetical protein
MISTVTATTITTITAITLASSLELVAILALLVFLIQKEIFSFTSTPRAKAMGIFFSKALNVAIVPLLISFGFIVIIKVSEVLQ